MARKSQTPEQLAQEWATLQAAYKAAYDADMELRHRLKTRRGELVYCTRGEQAKLDAGRRRESRALDRCLAWLDKHSPWDWHAGAGCHWICTQLTAQQATSVTPPELPAAAASYGMPQRPFYPRAKAQGATC